MIAPTDKPFRLQPCLVLAYADSAHAALTCRFFRRQGWEVHLASSGVEVRRLVRTLTPEVIVLDTDLRDESGWLTCAKLKADNPESRVVLVSPELDRASVALADYVGASALVPRSAGPTALVDEILGNGLATAV